MKHFVRRPEPHFHASGAAGHRRHRPHLHGIADPIYLSSERGLWAVKWSFAILALGASLQLAVALLSGSVALMADVIHNLADAATAVPLAIAFVAVRRPPSARFTYGYGRLEDLAGIAIALLILASAAAVGYETVQRLINPRLVAMPGAVVAAGVIGFLANEAVAVLRLRVGREIDSAALAADGEHARVDGLASLAVAGGAVAIAMGFPIADPLVGLAIAALIVAIALHSSIAVFVRILDGVDPAIIDEIRHTSKHVDGIYQVVNVRGRWIGHRLDVQAEIAVDSALSVSAAAAIADRFKRLAAERLPAAAGLSVVVAARAGHG